MFFVFSLKNIYHFIIAFIKLLYHMKKINFTVSLVYLLFIFVLTTALLSFGICLSSYSTVQSVTALETTTTKLKYKHI